MGKIINSSLEIEAKQVQVVSSNRFLLVDSQGCGDCCCRSTMSHGKIWKTSVVQLRTQSK